MFCKSSMMFIRTCVFAVLCLGCGATDGPELAEVTGTVTLDGKPLPRVSIRFVPEQEKGSPSYGATDASGAYRLLFNAERSGAIPGKHRVFLEAVEPETDQDGNPISDTETSNIPAEYQDGSTLTAEVQAGNNSIDFPLASQ